jgi:(p)ppGpp synthase/HD superfamily hydrolase
MSNPPHRLVCLARQIAESAHQGQYRRDGVTPHIAHCAEVAQRMAGDPVAEAAAWLHDILEDTSTRAEDLRASGISEEVIELVCLLTNRHGVANERYLAQIASHPVAKRIKIADIIANLEDNPTERQITKGARALLTLTQKP